ncbi:MAG: mycothiol transferase [Stackebrandtia sp.]
MTVAMLLGDAFDRVVESADDVVAGLSVEQLTHRPGQRGNSIAWLIWHLARVQDDHVCDLAEREQAWTAEGWIDRFDLGLPPADTGFGHSSQQVSQVVADAELLTGYLTVVTVRTKEYLGTLADEGYSRVIDTSWDPPVTLGVRLVSVVNDITQHVGQAAYVRGLLSD